MLRGLKERSGLSYGALAQRLHMSTSTLHRYCNGSAVPAEYAPAERLARKCRATPEELVQLHRLWILADAARGRKGPGQAAAGATTEAAAGTGDGKPPPGREPAAEGPAPVASTPGGVRDEPDGDEPVVSSTGPSAPVRLRRRPAVLASVAAVAVLGAVVLAVDLSSSTGGDSGKRKPAGNGTDTARAGGERPSTSASPSRGGKSGKPSAPPSASATRDTDDSAEQPGGVPLKVSTRPYVYKNPCSQHFLVDSEPEQVGPPAGEQDAPRWAAAYGAVPSGEQRVALTVQGTGSETVVLEALHVRVVTKGAPVAWNDYSMGVGCGGNVATRSFEIDLDDGSPTVTGRNGQRDFPYKVSESDPEVFYVDARTKAHDVRWDLSLDWSSGGRRGTVHVENGSTPFRTSANAGRPGYDYPLGGSEWVERTEG
ncbi:helix-turn-helix domain-containing protein [Streptomyces sp. DSM 42041]|uniref:Helix-turn-helix domain-containing protein n=1 Tax=Streptomyces hazeniae TaxID=3075538 RepID=A0ABU2NRQ2_9ACTN|nr:helix-turn-helix domain-containing protein [Streptomyces sp. DSM 42041]MDT0379664.1 helix-turn-helix domain-containing protein [Streptomyces sp. DSM 42041]